MMDDATQPVDVLVYYIGSDKDGDEDCISHNAFVRTNADGGNKADGSMHNTIFSIF